MQLDCGATRNRSGHQLTRDKGTWLMFAGTPYEDRRLGHLKAKSAVEDEVV